MNTPAAPVSSPATRQRLLEAAGPVFARHGFRLATVREICLAAGVNVAAINYHFGSKQGLYAGVLRHCLRSDLERNPPDHAVTSESPARERLFAFVHSFLLRIHGTDAPDWHGRLMAHEMMEPTAALDQLVEDLIRPLFKRLCGLVAELLGERADPERVILCARSVIGQCVFYHHSRPVMLRLSPNEPTGADYVERLARHITAFSLQGLQHLEPARRGARA